MVTLSTSPRNARHAISENPDNHLQKTKPRPTNHNQPQPPTDHQGQAKMLRSCNRSASCILHNFRLQGLISRAHMPMPGKWMRVDRAERNGESDRDRQQASNAIKSRGTYRVIYEIGTLNRPLCLLGPIPKIGRSNSKIIVSLF